MSAEPKHQIATLYERMLEAKGEEERRTALSKVTRRVMESVCPDESVLILIEAVSARPAGRRQPGGGGQA